MDRSILGAALEHAFTCFGRTAPAALVDAVHEAVETAPDDFADYIATELSDLAEMPKNLVRYVRRVLWPSFVASTSTGAACVGGQIRSGRPQCPSCGGTGWHRVWRKDAAAGTAPALIPCVCNAAVDIALDGMPVEHWTREDLEATGVWTWTPPAMAAPSIGGEFSREAVRRAVFGAPAEPSVPAPDLFDEPPF